MTTDLTPIPHEPALPDQQGASEPLQSAGFATAPVDHGPEAGARDEAGTASEPAPVEQLLRELEADRGANRPLDARIAVALYRDTGHADDRDNTHARLPSKSDECAPGTYWIVGFSGMSLRTAPDYTSDRTLKRLALDALRTAPTPAAEPDEELDCYDAGLLSDYGGGDIKWWQDYIRAELGRAHDFYASQLAAIAPSIRAKALEEAVDGIDDDFMTSEVHHPGYVLIPTAKFEQMRAALRSLAGEQSS